MNKKEKKNTRKECLNYNFYFCSFTLTVEKIKLYSMVDWFQHKNGSHCTSTGCDSHSSEPHIRTHIPLLPLIFMLGKSKCWSRFTFFIPTGFNSGRHCSCSVVIRLVFTYRRHGFIVMQTCVFICLIATFYSLLYEFLYNLILNSECK